MRTKIQTLLHKHNWEVPGGGVIQHAVGLSLFQNKKTNKTRHTEKKKVHKQKKSQEQKIIVFGNCHDENHLLKGLT